MMVFLLAKAWVIARLMETKVFPSPLTLEVTNTTCSLLPTALKDKLVRNNRNISATEVRLPFLMTIALVLSFGTPIMPRKGMFVIWLRSLRLYTLLSINLRKTTMPAGNPNPSEMANK